LAKGKLRLGRPPRHEGKRLSKNRTFRIRDELDQQLELAARTSRRSVSEEIEYRLDRSFLEGRPTRTDDAVRLVRIAMMMHPDFARPDLDPEWADYHRTEAEIVMIAVNIIIAAVSKFPVMLPAAREASLLEGAELARSLLRSIHVEWPQELSSLSKAVDETRQKRLDAFNAERAAEDAERAARKRSRG
jgi:hypothetical protein